MVRVTAGVILGMALLSGGVSAADKDGSQDPEPVRIPGKQKMPEFADISGWLNSPALKPADLRGKVVVVHFLAFG